MQKLRLEDVIDDDERSGYSFDEGKSFDIKRVEKKELRVPLKLNQAPKVERVALRLQKSISSEFMFMHPTPIWERLYNFSVIMPFNDEPVLYPNKDKDFGKYESVNSAYKTGATFLTYINKRKPWEWNNFLERMQQEWEMLRVELLNCEAQRAIKQEGKDDKKLTEHIKWVDKEVVSRQDDLKAMKALKYGQKLVLKSNYLGEQVRLYVSYRFQPMGRSTRGIAYYQDMYEWQAQANFPDIDAVTAIQEAMYGDLLESPNANGDYDDRIKAMVGERFEFIAGHQPYGGWLTEKEGTVNKLTVNDMNRMAVMYPFLKLAYVHEPKTNIFSKIEGVNCKDPP